MRRVIDLAAQGDMYPADDWESLFLPSTLERYIIANDGCLEGATSQLFGTVKWRHAKQPHRLACPQCIEDPSSHSIRPVGVDSHGRLVFYSCFATAYNRFNVVNNMTHLARMLEDAQGLIDYNQHRFKSQWVLFLDFHGYSWRDNDPRVVRWVIWLTHHYPERLGLAVVFGAGGVFDACWRLIRPVLRENTASKFSFLSVLPGNDPNVANMGPRMLSWLQVETQHNRTPGPKEWWRPTQREDGVLHDPRGLSSFVHSPDYESFHPYGDFFVDALEELP